MSLLSADSAHRTHKMEAADVCRTHIRAAEVHTDSYASWRTADAIFRPNVIFLTHADWKCKFLKL